MKAIVLIIILILMLSSCRGPRVITRYERTQVETIERDVLVSIRVPPIKIQQPADIIIQGDSITLEPSLIETDFCFSRVWFDGMQLQHFLRQKDIPFDTLIPGAQKETTITKEIEIPYEVNHLTRWQRLWITTGQILATALLIAFLFWRITK